MRDLFGKHKVNYATKGSETGRTMLEMLGVLGIMGIITYGAIAGINYGMSSYKINQTYSEVQDIIQGVEDLYSWSKGYPSTVEDLMKAACDNDVFTNSSSCVINGTNSKVQGAFGDMYISPTSDHKNFFIHVTVANSTDCIRLAQMDWKANNIKCVNVQTDCNDRDATCTCNDGSSTNLIFCPQ